MLLRLHFSICSLWRVLHLGDRISYSGAMTKKFLKCMIDICFVVCILLFAPFVYIELPLKSSRRDLHFRAMGFWLRTYSGAMTKISEFYDQFLLCHLYFSICSLGIYWAPSRELYLWAVEFWRVTYSGAMTKNFRIIWSIFVLSFTF